MSVLTLWIRVWTVGYVRIEMARIIVYVLMVGRDQSVLMVCYSPPPLSLILFLSICLSVCLGSGFEPGWGAMLCPRAKHMYLRKLWVIMMWLKNCCLGVNHKTNKQRLENIVIQIWMNVLMSVYASMAAFVEICQGAIVIYDSRPQSPTHNQYYNQDKTWICCLSYRFEWMSWDRYLPVWELLKCICDPFPPLSALHLQQKKRTNNINNEKKKKKKIHLKYVICLSDLNECLEIGICQYGGTCRNLPGSYQCLCPPGRSGKNCETGRDLSLFWDKLCGDLSLFADNSDFEEGCFYTRQMVEILNKSDISAWPNLLARSKTPP